MQRLARSAILVTGALLCAPGGLAQDTASAPPVLTDASATRGAEFFGGMRALANRGPACISCHDAADRAAARGRTLGPNLARAYGRLGGARRVSDWLTRPPTPMMHTTYHPAPLSADEVRALTAYLEQAAGGKAPLPPRSIGGNHDARPF